MTAIADDHRRLDFYGASSVCGRKRPGTSTTGRLHLYGDATGKPAPNDVFLNGVHRGTLGTARWRTSFAVRGLLGLLGVDGSAARAPFEQPEEALRGDGFSVRERRDSG